LGCGDTRARPRRYTGLVAGWSTAGVPKTGLGGLVVAIHRFGSWLEHSRSSQDRAWRFGVVVNIPQVWVDLLPD